MSSCNSERICPKLLTIAKTCLFVLSNLSFSFSIAKVVYSSVCNLASLCSFFEAASPFFIPSRVALFILRIASFSYKAFFLASSSLFIFFMCFYFLALATWILGFYYSLSFFYIEDYFKFSISIYFSWSFLICFYFYWSFLIWIYFCWSFSNWIYFCWFFSIWIYFCWSFSIWIYYCWSFSILIFFCWSFSIWIYYCWSFSIYFCFNYS